MKNVRKILVVVLATVALGMLAGCGSGDNNYIPTVAKSTPVTVVAAPAGSPAGSVAIGTTAVTVQSASGATIATIPASTVITPTGGTLSTTAPVALKVVTPSTVGDIAGMNKPTGAIVAAALGAVDISIEGTTGFTASTGLTVNIPVTSCPTASVPVTVVKSNGTTYSLTGTCAANVVTVTGVTNFCSFYAKPTIVTGS